MIWNVYFFDKKEYCQFEIWKDDVKVWNNQKARLNQMIILRFILTPHMNIINRKKCVWPCPHPQLCGWHWNQSRAASHDQSLHRWRVWFYLGLTLALQTFCRWMKFINVILWHKNIFTILYCITTIISKHFMILLRMVEIDIQTKTAPKKNN